MSHRQDANATSYLSILLRCFLSSLRLRFDSRIFFFNLAGRGDFRRRIFSRSAISAARFCCRFCSIASSNLSRASFRFCACDRESCTVTLIREGRCRSVTAVATLLTFWPPGPPDRAKVSIRSAFLMPRCRIRRSIDVSTSCSHTGAMFSRPCRSTRAIQISSFKNESTRRIKF
jgi:hypothetical protein